MHTIQTILHPTDFSESANFAFRLACSLARDHEADIVLLHVSSAAFPIAGEIPPNAEDLEEEERNHMDQLEALRREHPNISMTCRLASGNVVENILDAANAVNAGLIVMGTHGRTGVSRFLMGSVAEKVVRRAACSVLTVKAPGPIMTASDASEDDSANRPMLATPY